MRYLLTWLVLLCGISSVFAQLKQVPVAHPVIERATPAGARLASETPIVLPFWDDFSTSSGSLDTAWWMPGSQVQVLPRPGNGILPPTLNVVTFDGVDAQGNPYSANDTEGPVDSLLSRYIDLTQVPQDLRSSVYLSFFFQVKGNGNQPEPEDSLILYFRKADSTWQKMWPQATDIIPSDPTIFTEKIVNVPNTADFFHDQFQFMFRAFGRQNGWFDNWNIDYVYMDKRRTSTDDSYLDRAITDSPTSILGGYTAMPWDEFMYNMDPGAHLSVSRTAIRNLENDLQPVQYTAIIRDTLNNVDLETIADDIELILFQNDVREAITSIPDPGSFDPAADSLYLEIEYSVAIREIEQLMTKSNVDQDTAFYDHINLRVNDTARTYITIHDYFAYDDGSAEFGAGINQENGRIAYQFVSKTPQFVDRLDIYFPNISRNQAGTPIDIFILKDLDDVLGEYEGISSVTIQHDGINKYSSYFFGKSVFVQDTFYIGFTNKAEDGLWTAIGLDKNTNTAEKIYYAIGNTWIPNEDIQGSLMLRPHFIKDQVTAIEDSDWQVSIYPNPNSGSFVLNGIYDNIEITDLLGRKQLFSSEKSGPETRISINDPSGRLLLLIIQQGNSRIVRKIILKD